MGSCSMGTLWLGHKEMDGVFFFNKTTNLLNRLENAYQAVNTSVSQTFLR